MKKVLSLILILLLALTACGTTEKEDTASPKEKKTEDSTNAAKENKNTNTRELTAEDEKFSKMIVEKNYDEVVKETISLKTESQKDFYYIASAFIKSNENQTKTYDPADLTAMKTDYQVIVNYINRVKLVPEDIKGDVDGLKTAAEAKVAEADKQLTK